MDITGANGLAPITAATPAPTPPEQAAVNREIVQAVKALNAAESFGNNHELTFLLDRATKLPVIRIVDRRTKEVVDQIPPEYILRLAEDLQQRNE